MSYDANIHEGFDEFEQAVQTAVPAGAAAASPCQTWQSVRPAVLKIIAALKALGTLIPVAAKAAAVLQQLADLLDLLCPATAEAAGTSGTGTTSACSTGSESGGTGGDANYAAAKPPLKVRGYGWIPDLPDQRDYMYAAPTAVMAALPAKVDLRPQCPREIYDQGQLGSCTANAIAGAIEFDQLKQHLANVFTPSRLFIYYNERVLMGDNYVNQDSGAFVRLGIKSVANQGAPPERMWPYNIAQFRTKPNAAAYQEALKHKAILYQRIVRDLNQMKTCLASGYPFVYGFTVYQSFESQQVAQTGVVPMPGPSEAMVGGHAVLAVGYDDASQRFIVRNSWGQNWGMQGYFTMPYAYLLNSNLSDDFWTIRLVQ